MDNKFSSVREVLFCLIGLTFALLQGPLSRFGDTAANTLVLALLLDLDPNSTIPLALRTALGSVVAGLWRIILMPIDTFKTVSQVQGKSGVVDLQQRISDQGISVLYSGSIATAAATLVGHFPWFFTYNFLSDNLPTIKSILSNVQNDVNSVSGSIMISEDFSYGILAFMASHVLLMELARSAFIGLCSSSASDICSNSLRH